VLPPKFGGPGALTPEFFEILHANLYILVLFWLRSFRLTVSVSGKKFSRGGNILSPQYFYWGIFIAPLASGIEPVKYDGVRID